MDKVIKVIRHVAKNFNLFFYVAGEILLNMQKYNHIIQGIILFVYLGIVPLCLYLGNLLKLNVSIMIMLCVMVFYIGMFIWYSHVILLSVTGFLCYGSAYYLIFIFLFFIMDIFIFQNPVVQIILEFTFSMVLWWIFSLLANNRVGQLANGIFSTAFGLLVIIKDFIISLVSDSALFEILNISSDEFEKAWNIVMTPFLVINVTALVLCSIKGYWIEKYNNGNDISEKMIPDDEVRLHLIDKLKDFIKKF